MSRTIVIGDLHGCFFEAEALLDQLHTTSADRVIFTGDLVDRGPRPRECVELAMRCESVRGNHEDKHLQRLRCAPEQLSADHRRTRLALEPRHFDYFASLPYVIRLPEYGAAVVHAGALPECPLDQQTPYHLMHVQHVRAGSPKSYWPSKAPVDCRFWTNHWKGPERLIFGHSVLDQPLVTQWAVGVDTGAVFGRGLTALVLPDWQLVTLPTRDYSGGRKVLARYDVQDGVRAFS